MEFHLQSTFEEALKQGINLFLGAGFSILAKDHEDELLPTAGTLVKELSQIFKVPDSLDLPKISTILDSTKKNDFRNYLLNRFNVKSFDPRYFSLDKFFVKNIYTTNIDNLTQKIYSQSDKHYLIDVTINGAFLGKESINYIPLHGSIENPQKPFKFSPNEIVSAFSTDRDTWQYLRQGVEKYPTLFWGYSLSDAGVIEALFSPGSNYKFHQTKWIILSDKNESMDQYFDALGFNIIYSNTDKFLNYLDGLKLGKEEIGILRQGTSKLFGELAIPKAGTVSVRPVIEFYKGAPPIWFDVFSSNIVRTSHYENVIDLINKKKEILVLGIPASGKTTLMMQIAASYQFNGHKLVTSYLPYNKAKFIANKLGSDKCIIFIDSFKDNLDAFEYLQRYPNIKIIGFDREHNFDIISHRLDSRVEIYDITDLTQIDVQKIFDQIPLEIRGKELIHTINNGLFEFVNANIHGNSIKARYNQIFQELAQQSIDLVDLFVMCCYIHTCRTPVSFDMAYAFLSNSIPDYNDIIATVEALGSLLTDYPNSFVDDDQDYFQTRSTIVAETVIEKVPPVIFKRVLKRFTQNVGTYRICNYYTFKKMGYDSKFAVKAFPNWEEGMTFYEDIYQKDDSFYVLQQEALYLANRKRFTEAFVAIDKAIRLSHDRHFSIRNTHAIILFEANINGDSSDPVVQQTLEKSLNILTDCYIRDPRKFYHAKIFAVQAIQYYSKFSNIKGKKYLITASERLNDVISDYNHPRIRGLRDLSNRINDMLQNIERNHKV
jgi:hypothetical protein